MGKDHNLAHLLRDVADSIKEVEGEIRGGADEYPDGEERLIFEFREQEIDPCFIEGRLKRVRFSSKEVCSETVMELALHARIGVIPGLTIKEMKSSLGKAADRLMSR